MTNDLVKSIWPEWKIGEKPIGRGSYGAVYKAERNDHGVESTSAIKIISVPRSEYELDSLRSEGLNDDAAGEYLEKLVGDYVGEIRMLESFKGTQNIVSVEDYKVIERTDRIEEVLQFGGANSACESFVKKHGSTAMTSDEAEAWLEEQLRQDEEDTEYPFKITKTKDFLMGVSAYFQLYDNVSGRSIMLHVYLDGIVEGKYSKLGNEKYFSFRMDDLTAVNEDYCTFSVTGLTADAEIADVLKEAGVYEGREMRIYMTGCARSKLPRGAANAMNKLRDQDGINYLQFCIIYCEETESTYFTYGNFLSRIGRS